MIYILLFFQVFRLEYLINVDYLGILKLIKIKYITSFRCKIINYFGIGGGPGKWGLALASPKVLGNSSKMATY